jgi:hypothetical protein
MKLSTREEQILNLMREARQGHASAYDVIIFGNDERKQRQFFSELQWQIFNGPGEDLTKDYGQKAVIYLTLLKIPT